MQDEFAFATRIAGIHHGTDVLTKQELLQQLIAATIVAFTLDDFQNIVANRPIKLLGQNRQILQRPAFELRIDILRVLESDQVANGRADHPLVIFEDLPDLRHFQCLGEILRHGRLFRDDEGLGAGSGGFGVD